MGRMRPIRKHSFLVLELVIALFLIVTCLFPLLKPNLQLYRLEQKRMKEWEGFSEDSLLFAKIKQDLFEAKFSWSELKQGCVSHDCLIIPIGKTERESLGKEGLLLEVETPYRRHTLYVEREA